MSLAKKWTKPELFTIGVLFALLLGWSFIVPHLPGGAPAPAHPGSTNLVTSLPSAPTGPTELKAPTAPASNAAPEIVTAAPIAPVKPVVLPAVTQEAPQPDEALAAARREAGNVAVLSNGLVRLGVSRIGGGIVFAELLKYPESLTNESPLVLDFSAQPALALAQDGTPAPGSEGLKAFTDGQPFEMRVAADGRSVVLTAKGDNGLVLERTLSLDENSYRVELEDRFVNGGTAAIALPEYGLRAGALFDKPDKGGMGSQGTYLGIDTLSSTGGEDVRHWGSSGFFSRKETLADFFLPLERRGGGCSMSKPALSKPLPVAIRQPVADRTDWLAVKTKFFTQILVPEGGSAGYVLGASRLMAPQEKPELPGSWATAPMISGVNALLMMDPVAANPGETVSRKVHYYVGPKEYSRIEPMGNKIVEIMEFGMLKTLCWLLLVSLKGLYTVFPNYGVVIILLTILIRLVFWPITHKSTESMRRMQEIQPKITALREKFKDKPQKLQEETMKLYKEHKVNPIGGCLPMLIQIPVFIALFNVLRSAVELRYAGFLWIPDLCEPENLFAGVLPIAINILPIIMTATSVWQSHLTPSGGDPAQQKMMMFMPIMMLFIFYSMPSALVLYWTANQVLMIVQLLWQKRNKERAAG